MEIQIKRLILAPEYKTESKGHFKDSWEGNPKTFCFLSGLSVFSLDSPSSLSPSFPLWDELFNRSPQGKTPHPHPHPLSISLSVSLLGQASCAAAKDRCRDVVGGSLCSTVDGKSQQQTFYYSERHGYCSLHVEKWTCKSNKSDQLMKRPLSDILGVHRSSAPPAVMFLNAQYLIGNCSLSN